MIVQPDTFLTRNVTKTNISLKYEKYGESLFIGSTSVDQTIQIDLYYECRSDQLNLI
jgi:hypothetical protein